MGQINIKRYSLSKQVSDKLENMIENGVYNIDSRIPTEVELMNQFNVSRNTIREAVQSLVSLGILEVRQGDGTYVRANNRFDATMSNMLKEIKLQDINETRKTLEVSIAYYAALRRTDEDLEKIKRALEARNNKQEDHITNTILDIDFHMEIARATHNELLLDLYKSLYSFLMQNIEKRKVKTILTDEQIDESHELLYDAIKNQNGELAQEYARKLLNI